MYTTKRWEKGWTKPTILNDIASPARNDQNKFFLNLCLSF